jgi:Co/Zn/Cd efflux system component
MPIVAASCELTALFCCSLLTKEAHVDGRLMFITAAFGLCVNIIMMLLFEHGHGGHSHSHGDGHGHSHGGGGHGHSHKEGGHGHSHRGGEHGHSHKEGGHGHSHKEGGHGHSHKEGGHGPSHGEGGRSRPEHSHSRGHPEKRGESDSHLHKEVCSLEKKHGESLHGPIKKVVPHGGSPVVVTIENGVQETTGEEAGVRTDSHENGHRQKEHSHKRHSHKKHGNAKEGSKTPADAKESSESTSSAENGASNSAVELQYETRLPVEELLHLTDAHSSDERRLVRKYSSHSNVRPSEQQNINIRGAYLHVLGDLVQSVGVMLAGLVIWFFPEWQIVDLLCTLLFSVLVLATTVNIMRDILEVLLESTPRAINAEEVRQESTVTFQFSLILRLWIGCAR